MKLKTLFFGTPNFAIPTLDELSEAAFIELIGVVTQPAKPQGRGLSVFPTPVAKRAQELGLPVFTPSSFSSFLPEIQKLKPDLGVCVAYGSFLPPELISLPKYHVLNLHPSLLPKYRGASPIQEAILQGDTKTGSTLMVMEEKLDTGPILAQESTPIYDIDTTATLGNRLAHIGAGLFINTIPDYVRGNINPLPQVEENATYCQKLTKESARIFWEKYTADELLRCLRAFTPWPLLFTFINGKRLKILAASAVPAKTQEKPGTVLLVGDVFSIYTKNGLFQPKLVQLEGKEPMSIADFLRGYPGEFPTSLA